MNKLELEKLLTETDNFMKSEVYKHYLFTITTDLERRKETLCHLAPASVDDVLNNQKLYGELGLLQQQLTIFEEFRAGLKQKLAELV